jgi:type II secretory pathway component PulK
MNRARSRGGLSHAARRGMALLVVLWAIVLAAVVLSALQSASYTQAVAGREALARVRAYWAARGGVEAAISRLEFNTVSGTGTSAFEALDEISEVAEEDFAEASYRMSSTGANGEVLGARDAHAALNINRLSAEQLGNLNPLMLDDTISAVLDWIDPDDEANPMGAEVGYYQGMAYPYEPRNAIMRTIGELEQVVGATTDEARGEDWNQNGFLDPNEDDGDASMPPDNADGLLDAGWSGILTAESVDGGKTPSGEDAIDLTKASPGEVASRVGIDSAQADVIVKWATEGTNATMGDFIRRRLNQLEDELNSRNEVRGSRSRTPPLEVDDLGKLLDECMIGEADAARFGAGDIPGKLNVNTAPPEVLEMIPEIGVSLADSIVSEREGRPKGFATIAELLEVPGMTRANLSSIYDVLTVRSNVFIVRCKGRDSRSGIEVEIIATLDRSSSGVVVKGVRVQ